MCRLRLFGSCLGTVNGDSCWQTKNPKTYSIYNDSEGLQVLTICGVSCRLSSHLLLVVWVSMVIASQMTGSETISWQTMLLHV